MINKLNIGDLVTYGENRAVVISTGVWGKGDPKYEENYYKIYWLTPWSIKRWGKTTETSERFLEKITIERY